MPKTKKSRSTKKTTQTTPKRSVFGNRIFFLLIVAVFILAVLNKWIAEERAERHMNKASMYESSQVQELPTVE